MNITQIKFLVAGIIVVVLFGLGFLLGRKTKHCPEITTNTIIVHDTVPKLIPNNIYHYSQGKDSIIYKDSITYKDVDTAQILKNYFATYRYERFWHDTLIEVSLIDYISENKSINNEFRYKILRPQTVINNEQIINNYNKYIYAGLGLDLKKDISIESLYAGKKAAFGVGFQPLTKEISFKAYINVFKIK